MQKNETGTLHHIMHKEFKTDKGLKEWGWEKLGEVGERV